MSNNTPSPLLTGAQLSRTLGVTTSRVCQLRQAGMPYVMVGSSFRFDPEKATPWFQKQARGRRSQGDNFTSAHNGNGHADSSVDTAHAELPSVDMARSRKSERTPRWPNCGWP